MLSLAFLISSGRDVDYEKWKKFLYQTMITLALKGLLLWHISLKAGPSFKIMLIFFTVAIVIISYPVHTNGIVAFLMTHLVHCLHGGAGRVTALY